MAVHVVIMAGGIGSRFWPMSTPEYPKQFVDILGSGRSMIQSTVERFAPLCPMENFWVVTSRDYVPVIREQLPELPVENILAEPAARNTAPCVAYACWKIRCKHPDANVVFTPADAYVADADEFRRVISRALDFTEGQRRIVTVGICPSRPETGYGYIEKGEPESRDGIFSVRAFKEKPSAEVAEMYFRDRRYLWNAGIFVWNVKTIEESVRRFVPDLAAKMDLMAEAFYTSDEEAVVGQVFPACEKISIDYAVMEKSDCIYVIPADFGWSDLGTWGSLWSLLERDADGNAVVGENVHLNECRGCIVHAPGASSVVLQGLEDCIVVERSGRLLVCRLSQEQRIKDFEK